MSVPSVIRLLGRTVLLLTILVCRVPLPAYAGAASAWDAYTAGLKAMEAGDCLTAQKYFKQAIAEDPEDRRIRRGMFFDNYLPNAKLKELGTCPQGAVSTTEPVRIFLLSPAATTAEYPYEMETAEIKCRISGGSGQFAVTLDGNQVLPDDQGLYIANVPLETGGKIVVLSAFDKEKKTMETARLSLKRLPPPPLSISLLNPPSNQAEYSYEDASVTVKWRVLGGSGRLSVTVDGNTVQPDNEGIYLTALSLEPGDNLFILSVYDREQNRTETAKLNLKRLPPPSLKIVFLDPAPPRTDFPYEQERVNLKWRITGGSGRATVTVNGTAASADQTGIYSFPFSLLVGENIVEVLAFDRELNGGTTEKYRLRLTRSEASPLEIDIANNPDNTSTSKQAISLQGKATGMIRGGSLSVNGRPVTLLDNGRFEYTVPLDAGDNEVHIRLVDGLDRVKTADLRITRIDNPLAGVEVGKYYALIIGNNKYSDPQINPLETPINDARAVAKVLAKKYGFAVTLLENATRHEILQQFNEFRNILTEKDNFLIYYAGHGILDQAEEEGYWLPVDAGKEIDDKWIPNSTITNKIRALKARHILLVADSCYSGTLTKTRDLAVRKKGQGYLKELVEKKSRVVLTSGGEEPVADDGGRKGHSVFASGFLNKIEANDRILESADLFVDVKKYVRNVKDQMPLYSELPKTGHELGGDFLFISKE